MRKGVNTTTQRLRLYIVMMCVCVRAWEDEGCVCNFGRITIRQHCILKRKLYDSREKYVRSRMSKLILLFIETNENHYTIDGV